MMTSLDPIEPMNDPQTPSEMPKPGFKLPPMREPLMRALALTAVLTLLTGVIFPLVTLALSNVLFPTQAAGSLITQDGQVMGSDLIGQSFTEPGYFWGRPSATTPDAYNGAASVGSNLGTTNPALAEAVQGRIEVLQAADPDNPLPIPIDLVTASGSGLDPHISPAAARYQVRRVAAARGISEAELAALVEEMIEGRQFGFLGEPRVNVLRLNLRLDERYGKLLS